jgi:hypothetical protein
VETSFHAPLSACSVPHSARPCPGCRTNLRQGHYNTSSATRRGATLSTKAFGLDPKVRSRSQASLSGLRQSKRAIRHSGWRPAQAATTGKAVRMHWRAEPSAGTICGRHWVGWATRHAMMMRSIMKPRCPLHMVIMRSGRRRRNTPYGGCKAMPSPAAERPAIERTRIGSTAG